MTALTTSPFLTLPPGMASLTVATMVSPIPAYRRPEPPRTRMQRISFAPVLSATRSRDSCWITSHSYSSCWFSPSRASLAELDCLMTDGLAEAAGGLLGLLEDLHHAPALGGREGTGLHDRDAVADAGSVVLVVGLDLAGAPQDLAVERVLHAVLDLDHDGLVHLVAHHVALAGLAVVAVFSRHGLIHGLVLRVLGHADSSLAGAAGLCPMPSSRSRSSV